MRGVSDGNISATEPVRKHLDSCLDCRACETACPSNVIYHELIEETRQKLPRSEPSKFTAWIIRHVMPYPLRLKFALVPPRILQRLGLWGIFGRRGLMRMLPRQGPIWPTSLPTHMGKTGAKRGSDSSPAASEAPSFPRSIENQLNCWPLAGPKSSSARARVLRRAASP